MLICSINKYHTPKTQQDLQKMSQFIQALLKKFSAIDIRQEGLTTKATISYKALKLACELSYCESVGILSIVMVRPIPHAFKYTVDREAKEYYRVFQQNDSVTLEKDIWVTSNSLRIMLPFICNWFEDIILNCAAIKVKTPTPL